MAIKPLLLVHQATIELPWHDLCDTEHLPAGSSSDSLTRQPDCRPCAVAVDLAKGSKLAEPEPQHQPGQQPAAQQPVACLPGALYHPADDKAEGRIQALLQRRGSDALVVLRKWLREAIRADKDVPAPDLRFKAGAPSGARQLAFHAYA